MNERKWSYKVLVRYVLIQLPGLLFIICILLLIRRWVEFPAWIIWMVALISTAVDVLLFFYSWPSYDWNQKEPLIGETGVAIDRIDPIGHVHLHGEQWKAERIGSGPPIEKGKKVKVCGREGLILQIQPDKEQ
jgi:membrane-bound serine protease (ClpP class)